MRRIALALGFVCVPALAQADVEPIHQESQLMFGVQGAYVPAQNSLAWDIAAVGPYVSFSHSFDFVYVGARMAMMYAWLPSGQTGQQYVIEGALFLGLRLELARALALRVETGTGPMGNGGEGFPTTFIDHTYFRLALQARLLKSVWVEAYGGPSLVIGSYVAGVYPEVGLGAGWTF